jgi:hypothetical protein
MYQGACGTSRNLPNPQAVKLSEANSSSQYTKKGGIDSKSSSEVDN